ncbi:MAG: LCP family protein [Oscillospiraceae bacterium]|jgi:LCP family protein required for cell wall assembly|nr:LCP family protein [Oscillospiraceae bacterium]
MKQNDSFFDEYGDFIEGDTEDITEDSAADSDYEDDDDFFLVTSKSNPPAAGDKSRLLESPPSRRHIPRRTASARRSTHLSSQNQSYRKPSPRKGRVTPSPAHTAAEDGYGISAKAYNRIKQQVRRSRNSSSENLLREQGIASGSRRTAPPADGRANERVRGFAKRMAKSRTYEYAEDYAEYRDRQKREPKPRKAWRKRRKALKRNLIFAAVCVLVAVMGVNIWLFGGINRVSIDDSWEDAPVSANKSVALRSEKGITNILLLGIDADKGSGTRSDTIMIINIRSGGEVRLASILRDTYVAVPGHGKTRINHAYAYGKSELTMQTIENNFRVKLRKFVSVDMDGAVDIVDELGGVTIELTSAEVKHMNQKLGTKFKKGENHLSGKQAVFYARIRKIDSDFGRTSRQRKLISVMLGEFKKLNVIKQLELLRYATSFVSTNMTNSELTSLAFSVLLSDQEEISQISIPDAGGYSSKTISSMAVLVPNLSKNCTKLHEFLFEE